jgi:fluoroacetyl-CoA thioesterase
MLTPSQSTIVSQTLRVAIDAAAAEADPSVRVSPPATAHEALPQIGESVRRELVVSAEDTAAAMGHPDDSVQVLGSPRLALWFELVSCELLPAPSDDLSHVGVGILVHHLGRADVGETVTVESTCASTSGRRVVFTCRAFVGERVVGLGVHHRALLEPR